MIKSQIPTPPSPRRAALRRLAAFGIDWAVVASYGALLFVFVSPYIKDQFMSSASQAQASGFLLLTLPIVTYFTATEIIWRKTLGKKIMGLHVTCDKNNPLLRITLRNIVKFLPWELAHFSVWHVFMFDNDPLQAIAYITLITSYGLAAWYVFALFLRHGQTPYDTVAQTDVAIA